MRKEFNEQKNHKNNGNVIRDGYSAEELGAESEYDGTTEIEQRMRRGDETKGDANERDVVGASNAGIKTDNQPIPHRRNAQSGSKKAR